MDTTQQQQPSCPYCKSERYVVKAGLNNTGSQRMRCQECNRYFTPHPKPMGYDHKLREEVLTLYLEGMSFRGIAKVKKVNHQTVANWINAYHRQLPEQVEDGGPAEKVEIDELWTFVGKKKSELT